MPELAGVCGRPAWPWTLTFIFRPSIAAAPESPVRKLVIPVISPAIMDEVSAKR
ncbi:hypothetical protein [Xanthobacter variabilis]|uniref:hypothetical protein n=1 Tax=Xanthobacter variabilis TaxID=3119932 RepID=UPI003729595B